MKKIRIKLWEEDELTQAQKSLLIYTTASNRIVSDKHTHTKRQRIGHRSSIPRMRTTRTPKKGRDKASKNSMSILFFMLEQNI